MTDTDRGVSIALTHAFTVAITAVLLTGLLVGAGQLLDTQENRVTQQQFSEIGNDLVSQLDRFDRLAAAPGNASATVTQQYPRDVAGYSYRLSIVETDERFTQSHALELEHLQKDTSVLYPIANDTPIAAESSARGGPIEVCLDHGGTATNMSLIAFGEGCS